MIKCSREITARDRRFMALARKIAISVDPVKRAKIAAIIVVKNQIIAIGQCQLRSHPFQAKFNKHPSAIYLHAETNAIHAALNQVAPDQLEKATLYISRVKRKFPKNDSEWTDGLACPCEGCMRAIVTHSIKRVVYSTDVDGEYSRLIR